MTDSPDNDHKKVVRHNESSRPKLCVCRPSTAAYGPGWGYDDIIDLPHHRSTKRPHMPLADRAAQFSPFAVLTGHGEAIRETARLTDSKMELSEEVRAYLDARLSFLAENIKDHPEISVTYFHPDERKAGGAYVVKTGAVKKINEYEQTIVMQDGSVIPIDDIVAMDGEPFE